MSVTLPSLKRMSRERLSALLTTSQTVVVVDVRDSDHVGGHIVSSRHVPSSTLDYATPDLVKQLRNAPKVVFHCALSQQRGPSAALEYLRERQRMYPDSTLNVSGEEGGGNGANPREGGGKSEEKAEDKKEEIPRQEVYVLDGGFAKWQEKYGNDERLTENYDAELWKYGN